MHTRLAATLAILAGFLACLPAFAADMQQDNTDYFDILQTVFAVVALVLSLTAFILIHVKPFKLSVRFSENIRFGHNDLRSEPDDRVVLDLSFRNTGARPGSVDSVALQVDGPQSSATMIAHFEVAHQSNPNQSFSELIKPFSGFFLSGGQQEQRRLAFTTFGDPFKFSCGSHIITIKTRVNAQKRYQTQCDFVLNVEQTDLDELAAIAAQGSVPVVQKLTQAAFDTAAELAGHSAA